MDVTLTSSYQRRYVLLTLAFVAACTLAPIHATDTASESARLTLIQRQLDTIDRLADASEALPVTDGNRYHFDYARLHADIARMRRGIGDYLTPPRAQPRDPSALTGDYRVDARTP